MIGNVAAAVGVDVVIRAPAGCGPAAPVEPATGFLVLGRRRFHRRAQEQGQEPAAVLPAVAVPAVVLPGAAARLVAVVAVPAEHAAAAGVVAAGPAPAPLAEEAAAVLPAPAAASSAGFLRREPFRRATR